MKKLIALITLLILFGCNTKTNVISTKDRSDSTTWGATNSDNTTSTSETPPPAGCTAEGTPKSASTGTLAYYRFDIVSRGDNTTNTNNQTLAWRSSDFPAYNSRFVTDSTIRIRVMAYDGPAWKSADSYGTTCGYEPIPYTKLKIKVGIRAYGSSTYTDTHVFYNVAVNNCSEIWEPVTIPSNDLQHPFAVDIISVEWDWNCYNDTVVCSIIKPDCVAYELQVETDDTVTIPDK